MLLMRLTWSRSLAKTKSRPRNITEPAMIPRSRCRNSLQREAACPTLEQQVQSLAIVSDFVAGSIQCQVYKESAPMEIQQNNRWRRVQPRFLFRTFSAGKFYNCIFNIKYCSAPIENEIKEQNVRTTKSRLFR